MLGKTAGGLFWMFRYFERSENTARLLEAGFRMALTRSKSADDEWASVLQTAGVAAAYDERYEAVEPEQVIDFLLRDMENSSSVMAVVQSARDNARLVRTALTREVWESVNECWMTLKTLLSRPVSQRELPKTLAAIRQQSALVRAALHGTMLRNDIYDFARLGTFLERADNTARILDVKYYVLLPSVSLVGSSLDNVQWETILRSVSANRSFNWLHPGETSPMAVARFLINDKRMPRSLKFCYAKLVDNLEYLEADYQQTYKSREMAAEVREILKNRTIEDIFEEGLHEFLKDFIARNNALGSQIEKDFRFYG